MAAEEKEDPASEEDRLDIEGERNEAVEPQQPTKIQVALPSIDNNVLEESSVASDLHVSVDQDHLVTCRPFLEEISEWTHG